MMDLVSQALERNPAIVMKSFGWKYGHSEFDMSRESKPTPGAVAGPGAGARKQSGLIEGEVRPFRGDYRAAIDAINRFAETLSNQPNVAEVKVLKLPLNINPSLALSGNTTESQEQTGKAEFTLIVLLKPAA